MLPCCLTGRVSAPPRFALLLGSQRLPVARPGQPKEPRARPHLGADARPPIHPPTAQGAKLQHGHVPLYESGSNPQAKQFASLHGVQRHMVDTCRCKLLYDGNEEEYEEYYDYAPADAEGEGEDGQGGGGALIVAGGEGTGAGRELALWRREQREVELRIADV